MTKNVNPWELIHDKTISQLVFAYEAVLTEMRTHGKGDPTIRNWVERLDFDRDEFVKSMLAKPNEPKSELVPGAPYGWFEHERPGASAGEASALYVNGEKQPEPRGEPLTGHPVCPVCFKLQLFCACPFKASIQWRGCARHGVDNCIECNQLPENRKSPHD